MTTTILIIEDDAVLRGLLAKQLTKDGYSIVEAGCWAEAERHLREREPAAIIMDARLPDGDSASRLPQLVGEFPVIVLTAFGSVREAVNAIKVGAADYLLKPFSLDELRVVLARALENARLHRDHHFVRAQLAARTDVEGLLVGVSPALQKVKEVIASVAPADISVLLQGESGTGKELVAHAIHRSGPRDAHNLVAVDCCTIQQTLFESELFGHERGAFTGADKQKKGLIEGAEGGTLFLDEVGEVDLAAQAKLLRVLETGRFRRVGGTRDLEANVRFVSATNRDLTAMVEAGTFRRDLFYRLNGFNIVVPPLRERREDISLLAEHFLRNHHFSQRMTKTLSSAATRQLTAYDWPGNVRELRNIIERAIILSRDQAVIRAEHLVFGAQAARVELTFDHDPTLEEVVDSYLAFQLSKYSGQRAQVARVLGISERSIYRMVSRLREESEPPSR